MKKLILESIVCFCPIVWAILVIERLCTTSLCQGTCERSTGEPVIGANDGCEG